MPLEQLQKASNFVPETIIAGGLTDKGRGLSPSQANYGYQFYNSLGVTVIVTLRTGVRYVVPPQAASSFRGFLIRTTYQVMGGVNIDTHELWNDTGHVTSQEAELVAKAVTRDENLYRANRFEHTGKVDYVIQGSDFENNGGALYLSNLDILLSVLDLEQTPSHPHSLAGMRKAALETPKELEAKGLWYQIRIIDRHGRFGDRFVNLGGEVFHVKAERNSNLQDGVYAVGTHPSIGDQPLLMSRSLYVDFDNAEKELNLYRSYIEAKTLGNPQDSYKRELDEKAHAQKLREHEWTQQKSEWQREADERRREFEREQHAARMVTLRREEEMRDREREVARLEQELRVFEQRLRNDEARFKRDHLILKEAYDNRSLDRKETGEIIKHLPMLIGGLGALIVAVKRIKG